MKVNRFKNIDKTELARTTYFVRVFAKDKNAMFFKFYSYLEGMGFEYHEGKTRMSTCYEKGYVTAGELKEFTEVFKEFRDELVVKYCLQKYARNSRYREEFFGSSRKMYFKCAYCGKTVNRMEMAVDHIFPVQKMMDSPKTRSHARMFGIYETNCKRNLAPSCFKCNSDKGNRTGLWVIRGLIGRHELLINFMKVAEGCLAAIGIIFLIIVINMH